MDGRMYGWKYGYTYVCICMVVWMEVWVCPCVCVPVRVYVYHGLQVGRYAGSGSWCGGRSKES